LAEKSSDHTGGVVSVTFAKVSDGLPFDRELANWEGRIAIAAKNGGGFDVYRAALHWATQYVPPDNGLREKAKQEIRETADRHLADARGTAVIDAIYLFVSPKDATINDDLDTDILSRDQSSETHTEIGRLAALSAIEYERQRKASAEKLGITRVAALDNAVKAARSKNGAASGQGRSPSIADVKLWDTPVNLADALDEAVAAYSRYLILPDGGAVKMAAWSFGTHCLAKQLECFPIFPRCTVTSPERECAKSLLLRVLKCTSARPVIMTNANIAPLFRMISVCRPSIFLDEADNYLNDKPELLALLNDGYAAGGRVWRCEGDNNDVKEFDVFAPVAIAMINRPPDTLLSRSIEIRMRRKKRGENTVNFRGDRIAPGFLEIQRKFARAAIDHADALRLADPDMGCLFNRDADNWRPMFAIADVAGGHWPQRIREVAKVAVAAKAEQSVREKLLADIHWIFHGKPETRDGKIVTEYEPVDKISSAELVDHLSKMENRPWSEWKRGNPITQAALARQLATFPVLSGTIRLEGGLTLKGYKREDFEETFQCYLSPQTVTASQSNNDGHCDGLQSVTTGKPVTFQKASQLKNDRHCDGVTVSKEVDPDDWTFHLEDAAS
jgi:putative DNA primase/helicase